MSHTYEDANRESGSRSVKWNGIALAGRQAVIIVFSIVLARLLGPDSYGIVAQATVYITLTTLVLDQGVTAALVSRRTVRRELLGASMTLNIALSLAIGGITWPLAPAIAEFLRTPELAVVLPVLAAALVFKGVAIVPRMLLVRQFRFRALARAEIFSALAGGVAGVAAALVGCSYWAIVVQLVVSDVVIAVMLVISAKPPRPNFRFAELKDILGFSGRVFMGDILNFASRNADTVLVGRYLGETQVGLYSLAYRVLLTPIQMVGQTVSRVLFPLVARDRELPHRVSAMLLRCMRAISVIAFPAMALVAVASRDVVVIFLGEAWLPAVPVLVVLAVTGARQSITSTSAPIVLGFGRADIQLRFAIAASLVQVAGIVAGLPFGIVGVAIGYTVAGIALTPVIFLIQKRLAGARLKDQLRAVLPAAHASLWAIGVYGLLYLSPLLPVGRIIVGLLVGALIYGAVLRVFHRKAFQELVLDGKTLARRRSQG